MCEMTLVFCIGRAVAQWTRWPAMRGTSSCNCATQLSIWILLRTDVMKGDRCFWMCVCAYSTVNQTHHCTIHLCSLFGHGRRPCVHTLAQLHYWQKSALLNTTGQIHRWTNESIRLMKSCEEKQLHSCCSPPKTYTPHPCPMVARLLALYWYNSLQFLSHSSAVVMLFSDKYVWSVHMLSIRCIYQTECDTQSTKQARDAWS